VANIAALAESRVRFDLRTACAIVEVFKWQAVQAEVVAGAGFNSPCGSVTGFKPMGKTASELLVWHM